MKKIIFLFCLLFSVGLYAQRPAPSERPSHKTQHDRPDLTPDQIADLRVKELTLMLDLSEEQQKEIRSLELLAATERKEFEKQRREEDKPSDESRFENRSKMLDKQIAMKNSMKKILTSEQFNIWLKAQKHRGLQRQNKLRHSKRHGKKD